MTPDWLGLSKWKVKYSLSAVVPKNSKSWHVEWKNVFKVEFSTSAKNKKNHEILIQCTSIDRISPYSWLGVCRVPSRCPKEWQSLAFLHRLGPILLPTDKRRESASSVHLTTFDFAKDLWPFAGRGQFAPKRALRSRRGKPTRQQPWTGLSTRPFPSSCWYL